jgi:hypothetical protein
MNRMKLLMWLCSAALVAASSLGGPLTALDDQIASETKADAEASGDIKCWCKDVQSALDERLRNSESEISELEHIKDSRFYENVGLNIEVKQHQKQIADHSQSLQTSNALSAKNAKSHASEKAETTQSLKALREAMKTVPEGSEVHGTLKGLEDSFSSKLEEAQKSNERRQTQYEDMNSAKSEMLKLARHGAEMKTRRLSEGEAVISQAKSDISAYTMQREADWALQSSLKSVCGDLADAHTKRLNQRQDAVIAISDEKAKNAQANAQKAMSKVMLLRSKSVTKARCSKVLEILGTTFQGDCSGVRERAEDAKRRADDVLAGARKAAKDVMTLMDKSNGIQAGMSKVLSNIKLNSYLASSKLKLEPGVKGKISDIGSSADSDLKALPSLFDKVRAKAKESTKGDMKLVTSLQMGAAKASQAVVDSKKCE